MHIHNDPIYQSIEQLVQKLGYLEESKSKCCSLSFVQSSALMTIGRHQGLSVNALADSLNLDKSTASRHVSNLVQSGYVQRHESSDDRRYFELNLTEKGTSIYNTLVTTTQQYYDKIFSHMSSQDKDNLQKGLSALINAIDKSDCC